MTSINGTTPDDGSTRIFELESRCAVQPAPWVRITPFRHFLKRSNYSERRTGNALQTFQNGIGTASQSPLLNP